MLSKVNSNSHLPCAFTYNHRAWPCWRLLSPLRATVRGRRFRNGKLRAKNLSTKFSTDLGLETAGPITGFSLAATDRSSA